MTKAEWLLIKQYIQLSIKHSEHATHESFIEIADCDAAVKKEIKSNE